MMPVRISEPVEGRLEITRETSRNMVYLKLTGLTAQVSAVCYCTMLCTVAQYIHHSQYIHTVSRWSYNTNILYIAVFY